MTRNQSTTIDVSRRSLKPAVRLLLCVQAGGRCEFDGCNQYLLEHHVTLADGVFGQVAHIVAFRAKGPRGTGGKRPPNIHDIRNLMLLCPVCHKLVDDDPGTYPRAKLEEYKRAHEKRIRHLTSFGPDRSAVLIVTAPVAGHAVAVPFEQVIGAMAPRYPVSRDFTVIDFNQLSDRDTGFLPAACDAVERRVRRLFEPGGEADKAKHVSVFALAPMPLLVFLGRQLTNKVAADLYQRHRDIEDWSWKKTGQPLRYRRLCRRRGQKGKVALVISLSGRIPLAALPAPVRSSSTIYEITLHGRVPSTTALRHHKDLQGFVAVYHAALADIISRHGLVPSIDLFPAVPAPIAVLCGRELLPKAHPRLRVHDYDRSKGEFSFVMEV